MEGIGVALLGLLAAIREEVLETWLVMIVWWRGFQCLNYCLLFLNCVPRSLKKKNSLFDILEKCQCESKRRMGKKL
jgi:hypothetical protein